MTQAARMIRTTIVPRLLMNNARSFCDKIDIKKLSINEFGDPVAVVRLESEFIKPPSENQVLVKMLVASINPADINSIQGTYPIKPKLPGVPGFEGVGVVESVGEKVTCISPGDHVIPNIEAFGTWRTHVVTHESNVLKVPKDASLVALAGVSSNSSTAYRLLKDFVQLEKGDVVIQNGANSAAGQNVIQLCQAFDFKTVNVVRDRPSLEKLKNSLMELGATYIFTEEELRSTEIFKNGECDSPKLALNCVGGKSATELIRKLAPRGVMVTYGGMSREPVIIPTSAFIFKEFTAKGFWMTEWTRKHKECEEREQMLEELFKLIREDKLKAPTHELIPMENYKKALHCMTNPKGFSGAKFIFDFRS